MLNKRIYKGLSIFAITIVVAFSLSGTVYAANGDIWRNNVKVGSLSNLILNNDTTTIFDMISDMT